MLVESGKLKVESFKLWYFTFQLFPILVPMKVLLINTADAGGGAPAACTRLLKALLLKGADAGMLVQYKKTSNAAVTGLVKSKISKWMAQYTFMKERIPFMLFHEKDPSLRFAFSTANSGISIANHPLVKQADILHLHWTNSGFLSIKDLKALINTGKPIVWTMHDMWVFTGGCHYSGSCDGYLTKCGSCPMLRDADENDLSRMGWLRKDAMYARADNISFVGCSKWLADVAAKSSLINRFSIANIPNPIDVEIFSPLHKLTQRAKYGVSADAKVILFGAANINDKRKGITYLVEALQLLKQKHNRENIEVVIFGKNKHFDVSTLPFKVHQLNIINSEKVLAEVYNLADVFVTTSVEDNLPNMIMEAMACGTPVVAFETGGIPEMIDHLQNGYLATLKSAQGIADGIKHILFDADETVISTNARRKVLDNYTNSKIAEQYTQLYSSVLKA